MNNDNKLNEVEKTTLLENEPEEKDATKKKNLKPLYVACGIIVVLIAIVLVSVFSQDKKPTDEELEGSSSAASVISININDNDGGGIVSSDSTTSAKQPGTSTANSKPSNSTAPVQSSTPPVQTSEPPAQSVAPPTETQTPPVQTPEPPAQSVAPPPPPEPPAWVCTQAEADAIVAAADARIASTGLIVNGSLTYSSNDGYASITQSSIYSSYDQLLGNVLGAVDYEAHVFGTEGYAKCCYTYANGEYIFIIARG